jgi:hypothetical protein
MKPREITNKEMPENVSASLPKEARWLLTKYQGSSNSCLVLAEINDRIDISDKVREEKITSEFKKHGVTVTFEG